MCNAFATFKSGTIGCQSCKEGVNEILNMLKTDSVPGSIGFLMENVCPEMADPMDCEMKVGQWWGYISQIAFNDQVSKYFCHFMDPECNLFREESWNCKNCQNDVVSTATGYGNKSTIENIVDALQG